MFHIPIHFPKISWKLSEVLHKVGLNEDYVSKRRKAFLLRENIHTHLSTELRTGKPLFNSYHFGSSTEVSTTPGLDSDIDILLCHQFWKCVRSRIKMNLTEECIQYKLVEDETTPPGYCQIHSDCQYIVFVHSLINEFNAEIEKAFAVDMHGREILKNSIVYKSPFFLNVVGLKHGPATAVKQPGRDDSEFVPAIPCRFWPKCGEKFLQHLSDFDWPHEDVKSVALNNGCFLVPVGFIASEKEPYEWRFSASLVERSMMFSLNITQIRCYVLLKMILKALLKPVCGEAISSFHCKNVLFRCIRASPRGWTEENLLKYVTLCLIHLRQCVSAERCPNFVFEDSNLLAGKLSKQVQHNLENVLSSLIKGAGVWIFDLPFDNVSHLLQTSLSLMSQDLYLLRLGKPGSVYKRKLPVLAINLQKFMSDQMKRCRQTDRESIAAMIRILEQSNTHSNRFVRLSAKWLLKSYVSYFASLVCSSDININGRLSDHTKALFTRAIIFSPLCSRLKLASALYCIGDIAECAKQLSAVQMPLMHAQCICECSLGDTFVYETEMRMRFSLNEHVFDGVMFSKNDIVTCIEFTRGEMYCVPEELRCEMFKSTIEDRKDACEHWMESAVVDARSLMSFLSYLVMGKNLNASSVRNQRTVEYVRYQQLKSMIGLKGCTERYLGHRETTYNLLGQCYEKEGCLFSAFNCYRQSLSIRNRNNAASFHICRVLWLIFNQGNDRIILSEMLFDIQMKQVETKISTRSMTFGTFQDSVRFLV